MCSRRSATRTFRRQAQSRLVSRRPAQKAPIKRQSTSCSSAVRSAALTTPLHPRGAWRPLWDLYVGVGLPAAGRLVSQGWYEVGRFLGPSIRGFYERLPLERQLELWRRAGIRDVRAQRMSLGGGVVVWGTRT